MGVWASARTEASGGDSPTPSGERGPLERTPFESFRGLTPTPARGSPGFTPRFHGARVIPEEGSVQNIPSRPRWRSARATRGLGAMSAPSPPPPRPPLTPPGVDQSAWPAPPKCPGSALCDASGADMRREAPKVFDVVFHTTTGDVRVRDAARPRAGGRRQALQPRAAGILRRVAALPRPPRLRRPVRRRRRSISLRGLRLAKNSPAPSSRTSPRTRPARETPSTGSPTAPATTPRPARPRTGPRSSSSTSSITAIR